MVTGFPDYLLSLARLVYMGFSVILLENDDDNGDGDGGGDHDNYGHVGDDNIDLMIL